MRIQFLVEAETEIDQAAEYLNGEQPGLGADFIEEVNSTIQRITESPNAYRRVSKKERRCRTRRFTYAVVYRYADDILTIVAVMHLHRKPGYWKDRKA